MVNYFNNYFVNVGPDLAEKIPDSHIIDNRFKDIIARNQGSMFLKNVEENELINIVKKCKTKVSTDCNEIDMKIVKNVIEEISKPLTYIFNLSFQTGQFPTKMKTAKVIPLFKSGDKHLFTNYRPVSILPQLSEILEKLFNDRLDKFIDKYKLLTDSQYGFRKGRSTSLALTELIEEITNSTDKKTIWSWGIH